jgi:hypothetical protein
MADVAILPIQSRPPRSARSKSPPPHNNKRSRSRSRSHSRSKSQVKSITANDIRSNDIKSKSSPPKSPQSALSFEELHDRLLMDVQHLDPNQQWNQIRIVQYALDALLIRGVAELGPYILTTDELNRLYREAKENYKPKPGFSLYDQSIVQLKKHLIHSLILAVVNRFKALRSLRVKLRAERKNKETAEKKETAVRTIV